MSQLGRSGVSTLACLALVSASVSSALAGPPGGGAQSGGAPAGDHCAPAAAPAASTAGTTPETREAVDADGVVRRGVPVKAEGALPVAKLLAGADGLKGQTVTVTGTVQQVCAKKGCWMAIRGTDGKGSVRITAKDYKYFVPRSAVGMTATVLGEVAVSELDAATAEHYASESAGGGASPAPGREVAIVSVGLELRK